MYFRFINKLFIVKLEQEFQKRQQLSDTKVVIKASISVCQLQTIALERAIILTNFADCKYSKYVSV